MVIFGTLGLAVPYTPRPLGENDSIKFRYPTVAAGGGDGLSVLLLWEVGPMAMSETARVKYALYDASSNPPAPGSVVELGTAFAGTKPTVWVALDGTFHVVTTAVARGV